MSSLALVAALYACVSQMPVETITVGETSLKVEVAATPGHRSQGLMYRDSLAENRGMLFIYTDEAPRSFWMKDTKVPLSIAYATKDGKIVRISDMKPLSKDSVKSLYPATYALEVNRGWYDKHNIKKGDFITDLPDIVPE